VTRPLTPLVAALTLALSATGSTILATGSASAAPSDRGATNSGATVAGQAYDRLIVHFADGTAADTSDAAAQAEVDAVGRGEGQRLTVTRRLSTGGALVQVAAPLDKAGADRLIARFVERSGVAYAEVDAVMTPTLTPNDTHYTKQWHYYEPVGGMNLPTAWNTADGAGVVVAVLDTGITAHPDLDANVIAGYDFVSNATAARDGNGRDSNPADQGDWTTRGQCYKGSPPSNSSWHGTHVSGTVAAVSNNGTGVTGVAFAAKVQPVRVLAACGGTLADIADGITWASGGTVAGIPANPTPAKVINMSLGGGGTCGATYQNAINGAVSRGVTVIVAAGNSNANAASYQPASCSSTIVVAASDREGNRASYSNYGTVVDLTGPGGETAVAANGVASTLNSGTTTPTTPAYVYYQGTSMATPHIAGLAALVLGERAYTPAGLESLLKSGTRPLPGTCTGGCGTGLADAAKTIGSLATA
jgi:serine protease